MHDDTAAEKRPFHLLLGITGSIAAYKAASLASALVKHGVEVQCAATESALQFVGPAALEGITRRKLKVGMFDASHEIDHISLARWADLILIYPATAAVLARMRTGMADDLISALFLANNFAVPVWAAPAMNSGMLAHPAVQENIAVLSSWGVRFLEPEKGLLACGEIGSGRLTEPEAAASLVLALREER
jgi:phosphopantothenoylcysteine synthetase/decarboxylase